jgi:hypothetical protein
MAHFRYRPFLRGLGFFLAAATVNILGACAVFQPEAPVTVWPVQTAWTTETLPFPSRVMSSLHRAPKRTAKAGYVLAKKAEARFHATAPPLPVATLAGIQRQHELSSPVPPPPPAPPPPPPSPEVVAACGPKDTACQDQLTRLLADQTRKWIEAGPTQDGSRADVRLLGFRELMPHLTCPELNQGIQEAAALLAGGTPTSSDNDTNSMAVQLLSAAVKAELQTVIKQRC